MALRVRQTVRFAMTLGTLRYLAGVISLAAGTLAFGARAPNDAAADFVEIAAGPFTMGADQASDPDAFDNERWSPAVGQGTVSLPTFYIARHEVTVGEFAAFARERTWTIDQRALAGPPTHPVTFVSWP